MYFAGCYLYHFKTRLIQAKSFKIQAERDCWRPWLGNRVVILPGVCRDSLIWCFCRAEEGHEDNFDSSEYHLKAERAKMPGCGRQIILANIFNGNSLGGKQHLRNLWETRRSWETKLKKILEFRQGFEEAMEAILGSRIFWGVCWIRRLIHSKKKDPEEPVIMGAGEAAEPDLKHILTELKKGKEKQREEKAAGEQPALHRERWRSGGSQGI